MHFSLAVALSVVLSSLSLTSAAPLNAEREGPAWGLLTREDRLEGYTMRVTKPPADRRCDIFGISNVTAAFVDVGTGPNEKRHWANVEYSKDGREVFVHAPQIITTELEHSNVLYFISLEAPKNGGASAGGRIILLARDAKIQGKSLMLRRDSQHERIEFWKDLSEHVSWEIAATRPGTYELDFTYAADGGAAADGGEYAITLGEQTLKGTLENTKSTQIFTSKSAGKIKIPSAGKHVLTVKGTRKSGATLMSLKAVTLRSTSEGETPARPAADGSITLHARDVKVIGSRAYFDSQPAVQAVIGWPNGNDSLEWTVDAKQTGIFQVMMEYRCDKELPVGEKMGIIFAPSAPNSLNWNSVDFRPEASNGKFITRELGRIEITKADFFSALLIYKSRSSDSQLELRQIQLIPAKAGPKPAPIAGRRPDGTDSVPAAAPNPGPIAATGKAVDLRYQFKDGQKETYAVRFETGDDTDRRVREGNITYQFSVPSSLGFSVETTGNLSSRSTVGFSMQGQSSARASGPATGLIKFDNLGEISPASVASRRRLVPGDPQTIALIQLPAKPAGTWTVAKTIGFSYPTRQGQTKQCDADETHVFTIDKVAGKDVLINRTIALATKDQSRGKPAWEMSAKGTVVLEVATGLPLEGEWAGEIVQRDDRGEFRTPFRESFRRLGEQAKKEIEEAAAKRKEQSDKFRTEMARVEAIESTPVSLRKPLSKTALDKALADLKSKDPAVVEKAVEAIFASKPDPTRKTEVIAALQGVRHSESSFVTFAAMKAKRDWEEAVTVTPPTTGTKAGKTTPAAGNSKLNKEQETEMLGLIQELSSENPQKRGVAATALEKYPDPRAAAALAGVLTDGFTRREATRALAGMGPVAADHVLQHLGSSDVFLARSVLEVLKAQGTKKHVDAMQKRLLTERNGILQRDLREAITAAQQRE